MKFDHEKYTGKSDWSYYWIGNSFRLVSKNKAIVITTSSLKDEVRNILCNQVISATSVPATKCCGFQKVVTVPSFGDLRIRTPKHWNLKIYLGERYFYNFSSVPSQTNSQNQLGKLEQYTALLCISFCSSNAAIKLIKK